MRRGGGECREREGGGEAASRRTSLFGGHAFSGGKKANIAGKTVGTGARRGAGNLAREGCTRANCIGFLGTVGRNCDEAGGNYSRMRERPHSPPWLAKMDSGGVSRAAIARAR